MRKKQLVEGMIALAAIVVFVLVFFGAANLLNKNLLGIVECGIAFVLAVPVVILANREDRR